MEKHSQCYSQIKAHLSVCVCHCINEGDAVFQIVQ